MKILNVANTIFALPYFFGDQLSYFTKKGYEIHLICSTCGKLKSFAEHHGCSSQEIYISRKFTVFDDLKSLVKIYKYIRNNHFDIVSGHTPKAGLLTMCAAMAAGVKKRIFFRHGLVYETSSGIKGKILLWSERIASLCATKVVCISPYLIERSLKDHLTHPNKMVLLHKGSCTGIDADYKFNPQSYSSEEIHTLREALHIPDDSFVIGFVGRLVVDKGIVELTEAFLNLYQSNSKLRLLLVGPFEERDAVPPETINIIKTHPAIIHVGIVESGIPLYYSLMNVFVLPTHREGLGVALLEAQAMSVPALTTSHTGSRDAIIPGQTGDYIELSSNSIALGISAYLDNAELAKKHGSNGRRFILETFPEKMIWKEIENLYKE